MLEGLSRKYFEVECRKMLLAIDIGNTDTTLGVFEDGKLHATWHMATVIHRMADEYATLLLNLLHQQGIDNPYINFS